jgi:hypothetical protein
MNRTQDMSRTQGRHDSLAAFLARVRPGDSCACCGATLQSVHRGSKAARGTSGSSALRLAADAVVCPECGCEIAEETGPDVEEGLKELSSAA